MKTSLLIAVIIMALTPAAFGAKAKNAIPAEASSSAKKKNLSRDVVFSGSAVDGKYHSAGEGVAQVEDEKDLNMLIGIRKNFRDRLGAERAKLAAEKAARN